MSSSSLEVPHRQHPAKRRALWRILAIVAAVALVIGWIVWFIRTPDDLPTSSRSLENSGVVGEEVYVGMFAPGDDFDRTLHISDVKVDVEADGQVDVEPKICRDGAISVTTDATRFCSALDDPDGADFSAGDSIVLAVTASEATDVTIGRLEISFREGIRWGTKEAGLEGASLTFAEHNPGTVKDRSGSGKAPSERPGHNDRTKKDRTKHRDSTGPTT